MIKFKTLLLFFILLVSLTTAKHRKKCKKEKDDYDFIIIGGGLAGCVVATRLSENSDFSVLLLEAGGKPPLISRIPAMTWPLISSKYQWNFTTKSQQNAGNRIFTLTPGKMLGGSGSLNGLLWLRANKRDFDVWDQMGVKGWLWEDVLPYYKKVERDLSMKADVVYSGFNGPIRITSPWNDLTFYSIFLDEARRRGYKYDNALDGNQLGYNVGRINVYNNERQSSYTNYLIPALKRKNLKVIHSATVQKILFNDVKEAVGVLYVKDDQTFEAKARKEVIVSAGALNTPKILMLSGIGPKQHLILFGIETISDLEVGENYANHFRFLSIFTKTSTKNIENNIDLFNSFSTVNLYLNTDLSDDQDFPDSLFQLFGEFVDIQNNQILYVINIMLNRPKSKGTVRLASSDPNEPPLIDPNLFGDEYDMRVMLRMAQFFKNTGMKLEDSQNDFTFVNFDDSQCKHTNIKEDDYWRCIAKQNVQPESHHCCTAKMGSTNDPSAVVDNRLRVIGVKKLRVIDASVMPTVTLGNIQATVFMIAERGSEFVIQDHFEYS